MTVHQSVPRVTAQLIVPGCPPRPVEFGHRAMLDGRAVTQRLARELPPIAADLIEIAATVYVADQMAARPSKRQLDQGASWARDLSLEVPVHVPDVWNAHAAGLSELLTWLMDDVLEPDVHSTCGTSRAARCLPRLLVQLDPARHCAGSIFWRP